MKIAFLITLLICSSLCFAGEKGGNDGGELSVLVQQYQITGVCPMNIKLYCEQAPGYEVSPIDYDAQEMLRDCCNILPSN